MDYIHQTTLDECKKILATNIHDCIHPLSVGGQSYNPGATDIPTTGSPPI